MPATPKSPDHTDPEGMNEPFDVAKFGADHGFDLVSDDELEEFLAGDNDEGDEADDGLSMPHTHNEATEEEFSATVEAGVAATIGVSQNQLVLAGTVMNVFEDSHMGKSVTNVIIDSKAQGNPLMPGAMLYLKDGKPVATIVDLIALAVQPIYVLKFKTMEAAQAAGMAEGVNVYSTVSAEVVNFTALNQKKFTDASNRYDEEDEELYFSDDKEERDYLKKKKQARLDEQAKKKKAKDARKKEEAARAGGEVKEEAKEAKKEEGEELNYD